MDNIFVSSSAAPPARWRIAFPQAIILNSLPAAVAPGSLLWLHNTLPNGERRADVHVIVMHDEPSDEQGLAALGLGASGYCNSHAAPELLHIIASVVRSEGLWVGASLLNRLVSAVSARAPVAARQTRRSALQLLSEREGEVALCVALGDSNKEIARKLNIAERTIKAHLTMVFEKLNVRDRLQLAILLNTAD
ncbi:MAG: response regulator transcription factor [Pseudomonadota bacterium]